MNTKNLSLAIVAAIALSLTSCGNNKPEKETSYDEVTTELNNSVDKAMKEIEATTQETMDKIEKETHEPVEETEKVASTTKGSKDFDAFLKSYEEYVDQYIKLLKKSKNGDMSALTGYAEYLEKATDLSDKMEKAESEMTSAQMAKFLKIQAKLTQAAADMY